MSPTTDDFTDALKRVLSDSAEMGLVAVEVKSGNLHRLVGGYPGNDHRMPACCNAMRKEIGASDSIVEEPPKENGANLIVRYELPR